MSTKLLSVAPVVEEEALVVVEAEVTMLLAVEDMAGEIMVVSYIIVA